MLAKMHRNRASTFSTAYCAARSRTASPYNVLPSADRHVCRISCKLCEHDSNRNGCAQLYLGGEHGITYKDLYNHVAVKHVFIEDKKIKDRGAHLRTLLIMVENSVALSMNGLTDTHVRAPGKAGVVHQSQADLDSKILRFIIECKLPYRIALSPAFHDLILSPGSQLK